MGVLVGLVRAGLIGLPAELVLGAHIFTIEGYLFLVAAGLVEWVVAGTTNQRSSTAGIVQVIVGAIIGLLGPLFVVLALAGVPEDTLGPVVNLGLLAGVLLFGIIFFARIGIAALQSNPLAGGVRAWTFFGTLWFLVAILLWPARLGLGDPAWWIPTYVHVFFVGVLTNLLFGVISDRTGGLQAEYAIIEPAAMWIMNVGLVIFLVTRIVAGNRHGAWIMGLGVLIGALGGVLALYRSPKSGASRAAAM